MSPRCQQGVGDGAGSVLNHAHGEHRRADGPGQAGSLPEPSANGGRCHPRLLPRVPTSPAPGGNRRGSCSDAGPAARLPALAHRDPKRKARKGASGRQASEHGKTEAQARASQEQRGRTRLLPGLHGAETNGMTRPDCCLPPRCKRRGEPTDLRSYKQARGLRVWEAAPTSGMRTGRCWWSRQGPHVGGSQRGAGRRGRDCCVQPGPGSFRGGMQGPCPHLWDQWQCGERLHEDEVAPGP